MVMTAKTQQKQYWNIKNFSCQFSLATPIKLLKIGLIPTYPLSCHKAKYIPTVENTPLLYRNLNVKWFDHLESFGGLHSRSIYSLQLLRPSYCKKYWIQIILVAIILESHGIVYRNSHLHTHEVLTQPLSQSHPFQVLAPISQICSPKPS